MKVANRCQDVCRLAYSLPKSIGKIRRRLGWLRKQGFFYLEDLDEIDELLGEIPKVPQPRTDGQSRQYRRKGHIVLTNNDDAGILRHIGQDIQWAIKEFWDTNSPDVFV